MHRLPKHLWLYEAQSPISSATEQLQSEYKLW